MNTVLRTSERARRAFPRLAVAAVLLAAAMAYHGVGSNEFVLDDVHTVVMNRSLDSFTRVGSWFRSPNASSSLSEIRGYRPVLMASYALDRAVWNNRPAGYHLTNLLIHGGVIVLVFVLAWRLWSDPRAAAGASLWVALHPLNSEAVNYVTARSSSLMTLFLLAAVWMYDRAVRPTAPTVRGRRSIGLCWGAAVLFGMASLGVKEAAAVLPLLIMAWDRARSGVGEPWRMTLVRSMPFWGIVAVYLWARGAVLDGTFGAPIADDSIGQGTLFAAKIALASFGHWFWPAGLAVDHAWPMTIGAEEGALLVAGVAAAAVLTWRAGRFNPRIGWCLVWFWVSLVPVVVLAFVTRLTLYQEHRAYLGGIALAWIAGWCLSACARVCADHRIARVGGALLFIGLTVSAMWIDAARTSVWGDGERLWNDVLKKYPNSALAHNDLGLQFLDAGRVEEARAAFERSLRANPRLSSTHNYLGLLYNQIGEPERAIGEFQKALALVPGNHRARMDLGKVYEQVGRPDLALAAYAFIVRENPRNGPALGRTAVILEWQGHLVEAADRYRRVLAIEPEDDEALDGLATVLLRLTRWAEARAAFEALVQRRPDSPSVRFNLGVALENLGRAAEAEDAYRIAADLEPRDPDPYFRIAMIEATRERWHDAVIWYERALDRDPRHLLSHFNLALAAERMGNPRMAVEHYRAILEAASPTAADDTLRGRAREAMSRLRDNG